MVCIYNALKYHFPDFAKDVKTNCFTYLSVLYDVD